MGILPLDDTDKCTIEGLKRLGRDSITWQGQFHKEVDEQFGHQALERKLNPATLKVLSQGIWTYKML